MKTILILFLIIFFESSFAQANTQRFEFIGSNKTGSKVAFMLTHFGPSSHAPFANLYIYDSETGGSVVFEDGLSDTFGDEERMLALKEELLKRTEESRKSFGIKTKEITPLIGISSKYENQILIESDLFQGMMFFNTHVQMFDEPNNNCDNKKSLTYKISVLIESYNQTIEIPRRKSEYDCRFNKVDFSNLFKIKNYVWYIFYETHEAMPDLFFREFKTYSFRLKD